MIETKIFINQNSITMKKTLMVLSFALCASFAFAQTNNPVAGKTTDKAVRVAPTAEEISASAGYTGSIFTKDDDPIFSCTFANGDPYTTGTITAATTAQQMLSNGQTVTLTLPAHTNNYAYAQWARIADTSSATIASIASTYPAVTSHLPWAFTNFIENTTPNDGFMIMSMIDNYTTWGGFADAGGGQDAYIQFNINTTGHPLVVARFYQLYRKFNHDKCYVDYQVNGAWYSMEFNVKGVDMAGNSNYNGWKRVTLPVEVGNQANATIRIRYVDESDDQNGGYFWVLDDFTIIDAPDNQLTLKNQNYFEGFYQMMPQGLQVPVVWATEFVNDGKNTQTNVTGQVWAYSADNATASMVASHTIPTVETNPIIVRASVIDPLGWYDSAAVGRSSDLWVSHHGTSYWFLGNPSHTPASTYGALPTANTGAHYFYSDMTSSYRPTHVYGDTATFDTIRYNVNWNAAGNGVEHTHGVWARDHGIIRDSSSYTYGLVAYNSTTGAGTFSDEGLNWNKEDYAVMVGYVTGSQVPEGWKILGVEIVPATSPDKCGIYQGQAARIRPVLRYTYLNEDGSKLYSPQFDLGNSAHTITAGETYSASELAQLTFKQYGEYNTIKIWFNNQPDLEDSTAYYIGYELAEEGPFAAAATTNWFSRGSGAQWEQVWFGDQEGMEDYGRIITTVNPYSVKIYDPLSTRIHSFSTSALPMIHMLVGPGFDVPRTTITLECDNEAEGFFTLDGETSICGEVDSVPVGGSKAYYAFPVFGYKLDKIYVDGVALTTDQYEMNHDEDNDVDYAYFMLEDIPAAGHVVRCSFKENIGFDPVSSKVALKLQPNPASSNVQVSLKGVSGNVNMSVIDMSGRVVSTTQFNAENGTNINVSNLAKGAYFVRITNDKFSKVEKLIVR